MTLTDKVNTVISITRELYTDIITSANFSLYAQLSRIPFLDLDSLLQQHAKREYDPRAYDHRIVHAPLFWGYGYCREYDDGSLLGGAFKIYLDAPTGICLLYRNKPNAVVSFKKYAPSTLFIPQIQGVQQRTPNGMPLNKSWGIEPFDWSALLVAITTVFARRCGFTTVSIQSATNNRWKTCDTALMKRLEKYYDNTAKHLGFEQREDKNWYKQI